MFVHIIPDIQRTSDDSACPFIVIYMYRYDRYISEREIPIV